MNKITVVLPTYNRFGLLKKAYASCKNQSNQNFDLIVIDNGSTDGSQEYLREIQGHNSREQIILNPANIGSVKSINKALSLVTTEWATILCDDDYFEENFIERILNEIHSTQKHLVVVGFNKVDSNGNILGRNIPQRNTYNLNDILHELFVSSGVEIAGISGCAFKTILNTLKISLKEYPKGFWTDALIQAQMAISGNGAETIDQVLYNRLDWQGSESALSVQNLKFFNEALLLFKNDLAQLLANCVITDRLRTALAAPQPLAIFFRITCKPILFALSLSINDVIDFQRIFLRRPGYHFHRYMIFSIYIICAAIPLRIRTGIRYILKKRREGTSNLTKQ